MLITPPFRVGAGVPPGGALNRSHPLNAGVLARWLCLPGRLGGQTWYDVAGARHGTYGASPSWGATTRPGGYGHVNTNGSNYIDCGAVPLDSNNWTLAAWVRINASGGSRCIAWHGDGPTLYWEGNTISTTSGLDIAHGGSIDLSSTTNLNLGVWAHVVLTRSGSTLRIFKDGAKVAENASYSGTFTANSTFRIGNSTAFGENVNASFDDVGAWNRGLSESEARALYVLSRAGYPGLLNRSGPGVALFGSAGGGGTTFTSSLSGSLTASASLARSTRKAHSGTLAASATLARRAGKALSGGLTASGSFASGTRLLVGLAAYYQLDEASGDAIDATGNGNTAIDHGSVGTASGKINTARTFDGSTRWLSLPTNFGAGASPGGPFSASLWAYADATSGDQVLLGRYEPARDRMFQLWLRGTHLGVAYGSNPFDTIDDAGSISAGTWHHLAFTFSTLGVGTLYVDGSSVGSDPSPTADFTSTATLDAGRRSDGMFPFAGRLDEIGWWSRELTAGEVSTLYNGGNGLPYSSLGGISAFLKSFSGSLAASATLARRAGKALSGTLTASGTLAKIRAVLKSFSGSLTASASLARSTGKALAGSLAASATLARSTLKSFAGTLTASGTLAKIRAVLKSFSGGLAASGSAVTRQTGKALSGTLAASGTTTRAVSRALAGTLAASASLARRTGKPLAGTLSATGSTVARSTAKALSGSLAASGSLSKRVAKALSGVLAASGSFLKSIVGAVFRPSRHPDPSRSTGRRLGPDPSRSTGSRD